MAPLSAALLLLLAAPVANPARACKPAKPDARVYVSFLANSDLPTLAKWAKQATCIDYTFEPALASRRLTQGVILTVTGRDTESIFEILLHSMNLRTYGRGAKRAIVADGPETARSREVNEREKAGQERDRVLANIDDEIKRKDDSHYTITRRGADAVMASLPSIARTVRIVPEAKGGKPIGFRLLSLRPGAILTRVGFQNGDVVRSLNDNELTSPDKAVEAYTRFRTTGVIRAGFVRDSKPLWVEIKIE